MKDFTWQTCAGLSVLFALALGVTFLSQLPFLQQIHLSPLVLGIIAGMCLANSLRPHFPSSWDAGFRFAGKRLLRAGIILYGFRITLDSVFLVGKEALIIDLIIVSGTLLLGNILGKRLGLDRDERLLVASGSAICGAAAVLATEPVLGAKPHKTVIATATVVLFGTLSMFVYPLLYRAGLLDALTERGVGIYTGATVHEVAHVVGAGAAMGSAIAPLATITKMLRVVLLAPTLLALSYLVRPQADGQGGQASSIPIPWFAFYFLFVIGLHSLLTYLSREGGWGLGYQQFTQIVSVVDNYALTMAMTAIGLDATLAKFKQSGTKPFLLALGLYLWLVLGGYLLTLLLV